MGHALHIVPSVIASCSACTSTYNNTTVNHSLSIPMYSIPSRSRSSAWPTDELIQHTVSYNLEKPEAAAPSKSISMVRRQVSYQTVPRSNKFPKNSAKSLRRRGALFQPGRTNCNQRTIR